MRAPIRLLYIAVEIVTTAVLVGLIWLYASRSSSPYVPKPTDVVRIFRTTWIYPGTNVRSDLVPSLERIAEGYVIAAVLGVTGGVALARFRYLQMATEPMLTFLRSTPPPALLPLFIALLGIGSTTKVTLIAFVCVWPILLNVTDGVRSIDPTILETARSFGIGGVGRLFRITLPAAAPRIFSGLRISLSISILILVVSEMIGSTNGLGFYILHAQQTFSIPQMWAGIILLGILGFALNALFTAIERRVIPWHLESMSATR